MSVSTMGMSRTRRLASARMTVPATRGSRSGPRTSTFTSAGPESVKASMNGASARSSMWPSPCAWTVLWARSASPVARKNVSCTETVSPVVVTRPLCRVRVTDSMPSVSFSTVRVVGSVRSDPRMFRQSVNWPCTSTWPANVPLKGDTRSVRTVS